MILLRKGSHRNTQCFQLAIGDDHWFGISYETVIAYRGAALSYPRTCRLDNIWGPTTRRHMSDLGVYHWRVLSEADFAEVITRAVMMAGCNILRERFKTEGMTTEEALKL